MRALIRFSPNTHTVPFNHLPKVVGFIHRCIGKDNALHDSVSLYSLGWLQGGVKRREGLHFPEGAQLTFSSPDSDVLLQLMQGIQEDAHFAFGMVAEATHLQQAPMVDTGEARFGVASPVLVRKEVPFAELPEHIRHKMEAHGEIPETATKYLTYEDGDEADALLTQVLHTKLAAAGLPTEGASVAFDRYYLRPRVKLVNYKGTQSKATVCPVIVSGSAEQIAFCWNVGVGQCTGISYGSLK